ncbi:unannotated protein [freshwater metagenome]|uniref:Unannotated protein n=1 Tax=freshwater metagenome TaxID=449393 RepID=A0A6J7GUR9_9ZZZZ
MRKVSCRGPLRKHSLRHHRTWPQWSAPAKAAARMAPRKLAALVVAAATSAASRLAPTSASAISRSNACCSAWGGTGTGISRIRRKLMDARLTLWRPWRSHHSPPMVFVHQDSSAGRMTPLCGRARNTWFWWMQLSILPDHTHPRPSLSRSPPSFIKTSPGSKRSASAFALGTRTDFTTDRSSRPRCTFATRRYGTSTRSTPDSLALSFVMPPTTLANCPSRDQVQPSARRGRSPSSATTAARAECPLSACPSILERTRPRSNLVDRLSLASREALPASRRERWSSRMVRMRCCSSSVGKLTGTSRMPLRPRR